MNKGKTAKVWVNHLAKSIIYQDSTLVKTARAVVEASGQMIIMMITESNDDSRFLIVVYKINKNPTDPPPQFKS